MKNCSQIWDIEAWIRNGEVLSFDEPKMEAVLFMDDAQEGGVRLILFPFLSFIDKSYSL